MKPDFHCYSIIVPVHWIRLKKLHPVLITTAVTPLSPNVKQELNENKNKCTTDTTIIVDTHVLQIMCINFIHDFLVPLGLNQ